MSRVSAGKEFSLAVVLARVEGGAMCTDAGKETGLDHRGLLGCDKELIISEHWVTGTI